MIKKILKYGLSLILLLGMFASSKAQQVEFKGSAPRVVEAGEQFRLRYSVNAKGSDFKQPPFKGFRVLTGPNVSTSSSVQIVNGNMSKSVEYTYTYVLQAMDEGKTTIPPAQIEVKGRNIQSNAITIEVVKGASGNNTQQGNTSSNVDKANISNKDLFVAVNVDRKNLYQGESLVATIKVYTRKSLAGFEDYKFPPFTGFWSQDIEAPQQIQLQRENVNGQIYEAGLFKKVLLFPQRSGEITIDPFEITMLIRERTRSTNPFDDFFGGSYRTLRKRVASAPVTINVKPLPANKPSGFEGAVGVFKMNASVDKTEVKANEAVNLNIKISGTGNLKLIKPLKVDFPPDMDVYDPKTSLNTKVTENGVTGSISFNYLVIPRYAGTYRIAPVVFSYFDSRSNSYKTVTSDEFEIKVARGSGDEQMSSGVVQSLSKEDVKYIGKDIRFIKNNIELKKKQRFLFGSKLFYAVFGLAFLLFVVILLFRWAQIKQNANQARVRNRKANKVSRKRLKKAAGFMKQNNTEQFYDEVLRAIWGYLSDKLNIPVSELSKDNVTDILEKRQVDKDSIGRLTELLNACEFARFAPAAVSGGMDENYKKASQLISKLDQKIK